MFKKLRRKYNEFCSAYNAQSRLLRRSVSGCNNYSIDVVNRSDIQVEDGAQIIMKKGSKLSVNVTNFSHKYIQPALLHLGKNSTLIIDGEFTMFEGAKVYLGDNAILEIHGNSFMNASDIDCSKHIILGDDVAIASGG